MTKQELAKKSSVLLRNNGVKKSVNVPAKHLTVSDDNGNSKKFVVNQPEHYVNYTLEDVLNILNAAEEIINDALVEGEDITLRGFMNLALRYREPRLTTLVGTNHVVETAGGYYVKISPGTSLKKSAKIRTLIEKGEYDPAVDLEEDDDESEEVDEPVDNRRSVKGVIFNGVEEGI